MKYFTPYTQLAESENGSYVAQNQRKRCSKRTSLIFGFWVAISCLCFSLYMIDGFGLRIYSFDMMHSENFSSLGSDDDILTGYLINTQGCKIPEMKPFDPAVIEFISHPPKLVCNKGQPPLFGSTNTSIYLIQNSTYDYNISSFDDMSCCYNILTRMNPNKGQADKAKSYSETCITINETSTNINEEFIKVTCSTNKTIYTDFFAFAPLKRSETRSTSTKLKPNILVLGLDAVSRVNFHRQMPETAQYILETLGGVELMGYNKVADNTFVNLVPVLIGHFEEELKHICWPNSGTRFDNCTFFWKKFSELGYVTGFGEDCSWMGVFNYAKKGFYQQPTDYYYSSYEWIVEDNIGNDKDFNCNLCVGGRPVYQASLDYIRKFVSRTELESQPFFGFFWTVSISHDYLNYPALSDSAYYHFFDELNQNGYLNNTVLIFMSDHGIRWGGIRQTYQGQLEERLPFVFVVLPEHIKKNYPKALANLKKNARRLTTPFDLHETLKNFMDMENFDFVEKEISISRGYSLFGDIPTNRSCKEAEIPSHWCTCQQSTDVSVDQEPVITSVNFAVQYMNVQLKGYAQCAPLTLNEILRARLLQHEEKEIEGKAAIKDYTVVFITMPGNGTFEATVRMQHNSSGNHSYSVTGTISRLNLYGKQSSCVLDFHIKLYCYCRSLLNL